MLQNGWGCINAPVTRSESVHFLPSVHRPHKSTYSIYYMRLDSRQNWLLMGDTIRYQSIDTVRRLYYLWYYRYDTFKTEWVSIPLTLYLDTDSYFHVTCKTEWIMLFIYHCYKNLHRSTFVFSAHLSQQRNCFQSGLVSWFQLREVIMMLFHNKSPDYIISD